MPRPRIDRPGHVIFLAGVAVVIASTVLGLYLAALPIRDFPHADWHNPGYDDRLEEIRRLAVEQASLVTNLHALMWFSFGLGTVLTFMGLRMLTQPDPLLETAGPIKPTLDICDP